METGLEKKDTEGETKPAVQNNGMVQTIDISGGNIAEIEKQLEASEAAPFELTDGYWTPEKLGESKKVLLKEIKSMKFLAQTGEEVELETACLVEIKDGVAKNITNAGWRLVKSLKNFNPGSAFLITYLGKRKNSQNQNMSDDWSIKPLMIKMQ
jgi:hypothetical protein